MSFNQTSFYRYNESIRYYNFFYDTVYSITKRGIFPHLIIHASDPMTVKDIKNFKESDSNTGGSITMQLMRLNKAFGLSNYLENSSTVYFRYTKGLRTYSVIFDKTSNVSRICRLRNDILQSRYISAFNACTDEYFIQHYLTMELIELKKRVKSGEVVLGKENEIILNGVDMQDNPVLFFFKNKT